MQEKRERRGSLLGDLVWLGDKASKCNWSAEDLVMQAQKFMEKAELAKKSGESDGFKKYAPLMCEAYGLAIARGGHIKNDEWSMHAFSALINLAKGAHGPQYQKIAVWQLHVTYDKVAGNILVEKKGKEDGGNAAVGGVVPKKEEPVLAALRAFSPTLDRALDEKNGTLSGLAAIAGMVSSAFASQQPEIVNIDDILKQMEKDNPYVEEALNSPKNSLIGSPVLFAEKVTKKSPDSTALAQGQTSPFSSNPKNHCKEKMVTFSLENGYGEEKEPVGFVAQVLKKSQSSSHGLNLLPGNF